MKRTILSVSGLAAGLLLLATGCKKVDSADLKETVPYYQEYNVTYNKTEQTMTATALIRVRDNSGSRVDLTDGAYIRANGVDENNTQPTTNTYDWAFPGNKDVRFDLKKNSGDVITNTTMLSDIGITDFPSTLRTNFPKKEGFKFNWEGDDLDTDEELNVTITGRSIQSALIPFTSVLKVTGKEVAVDSNSLVNIMTGDVNIKMVRTRSMPLDAADGTSGGGIKVIATVNRTLSMN
jgi:hypothetical protein